MTGREILEQVIVLLGQVSEGDEAEELCLKLKAWLLHVLGSAGSRREAEHAARG